MCVYLFGGVEKSKKFEQFLLVFFFDTDPIVFNFKFEVVFLFFAGNLYEPATWSELESITHQIHEDLLDSLLVGTDEVVGGKVAEVCLDRNSHLLCFIRLHQEYFLNCRVDVELSQLFPELSLFKLREVQHVVDLVV